MSAWASGMPEAAATGPVTVVDHPELRTPPGVLLLALQVGVLDLVDLRLGLELVGDPLGPAAQVLEREPAGIADQRVLTGLLLLRGGVIGQVGNRGGDDRRLRRADVTASQRVPVAGARSSSLAWLISSSAGARSPPNDPASIAPVDEAPGALANPVSSSARVDRHLLRLDPGLDPHQPLGGPRNLTGSRPAQAPDGIRSNAPSICSTAHTNGCGSEATGATDTRNLQDVRARGVISTSGPTEGFSPDPFRSRSAHQQHYDKPRPMSNTCSNAETGT